MQAVRAIRQTRRIVQGSLVTKLVGLLTAAIIIAYLAPKMIHLGPGYFERILVIGLALGAIYALIAIGYTMVYGIVELINFAHGDVFTLGGFFSLPLLAAFGVTEASGGTAGIIAPLIATFAIVMLLTGLINIGIERVAYRPLRNAPRLAPLITAVGVSYILEGAMFLWKGAVNIHYPDILPANRWFIGDFSIGAKDIIAIVVAVVLVVGLAAFVNLSTLGKAMRATAQDRDAARLMGINIDRTIAATFFVGAALAGAGGIMFGLYVGILYNTLGFAIGLVAFTAAVFGGIGNIPGAALGGLTIGIIRALNDGYVDPEWTDVVTFAVLILVLTLRPTGLLGMRVPEK